MPSCSSTARGRGSTAARASSGRSSWRSRSSEIENLRSALRRPPLLLLDDVSSELDPAKNGFLLEYLGSLPGQSFLTTTDERLLGGAAGPESTFFRVENGALFPLIS